MHLLESKPSSESATKPSCILTRQRRFLYTGFQFLLLFSFAFDVSSVIHVFQLKIVLTHFQLCFLTSASLTSHTSETTQNGEVLELTQLLRRLG